MDGFWFAVFENMPPLSFAESLLFVLLIAVCIGLTAIGVFVRAVLKRKDAVIDRMVDKISAKNGYLKKDDWDKWRAEHDGDHAEIKRDIRELRGDIKSGFARVYDALLARKKD